MKTKREQKNSESGNALIYVLIAIALFAALGFTLSRQTDTSEVGSLDDERAELYATQLISYAAQSRQVIDQMMFTAATQPNDLDFTPPTDGTYDTGTLIHKVYHPQGGGLNPGTIPPAAINAVTTDPDPGWYLGRFNNVDWTGADTLTTHEVILTAFQISENICGLINEKINGSTAIPSSTASLRSILIDENLHSGSNVEFTTGTGNICPACENQASLCIEEGGMYAFYTILADQ